MTGFSLSNQYDAICTSKRQSEKSPCVFQVSGSCQLLSRPGCGTTRGVLLGFQDEADFKTGAMQAAEMAVAPGLGTRSLQLLEVLGAASKGQQQQSSLPCC